MLQGDFYIQLYNICVKARDEIMISRDVLLTLCSFQACWLRNLLVINNTVVPS